MPSWGDVLEEVQQESREHKRAALDIVRRRYLSRLSEHTGRDVIFYGTKWTGGDADPGKTSISVEDVQGLMAVIKGLRTRKLDLILHSPGGSAEAAEAIVEYLRCKFDDIRVIVPHMAMSAATLLACAADEIIMGGHSFLGPIDPQFLINGPNGLVVAPAQAILDQFDKAKKECTNPQLLGAWMPMLAHYGPALLVQCENAMALSQQLAYEWLQQWMFKDEEDRERIAKEIAAKLNNHRDLKSHGRPISRRRAQELGLKVGRLEDNQLSQDLVLSAFHATTITFDNTSAVKIIENSLGKAFVKNQQTLTVQMPVQLQPQPITPEPAEAGAPSGN